MSADEQVDGLDDVAQPPDTAPASDEVGAVASAPPASPGREPTSPFDCLDLSTPLEELDRFARARVEALVRAGDAERVERTRAALELGKRALRDVMGGRGAR